MTLRRIPAVCAIAACLVLSILWTAGRAAPAAGPAAYCSGDYKSLQQAIDAAGHGDTVLIEQAECYETIVVSETITLLGGWATGCGARTTTDPTRTVIDGNGEGPVVWISGGSPVLDSLTVTGGESNRGAGVRIEADSPTLANVVVQGNVLTTTADEHMFGAGVYVSGTMPVLDDCAITRNVAYAYSGRSALGAGLYVEAVSQRLVLIATRIEQNGPAGDDHLLGGGIYAWAGDAIEFAGTQNVIAHNRAVMGGGVYTRGRLTGTLVLSNTADYGGGIYLDGHEAAGLVNNIVVGNLAETGGSGIHVVDGGFLINNTIVGNIGAGIDIDPSGAPVVTITNNIVANHKFGIRNQHATVSPTLVTNDLWNNSANYVGVLTGTTDIHVDPAFADPGVRDFHLTEGSGAIDAGTTIEWLDSDFEGDFRPIGSSHDMGADEWGRFSYLPLVMRGFPP